MKIIMGKNSQNIKNNDLKIECKKQEEDSFEIFNGQFLHPSLDIKDDILTIGFRYRAKLHEERNIFIVVIKGSPQIINVDTFPIGDKNYYFENRNRKLVRLEQK